MRKMLRTSRKEKRGEESGSILFLQSLILVPKKGKGKKRKKRKE